MTPYERLRWDGHVTFTCQDGSGLEAILRSMHTINAKEWQGIPAGKCWLRDMKWQRDEDKFDCRVTVMPVPYSHIIALKAFGVGWYRSSDWNELPEMQPVP